MSTSTFQDDAGPDLRTVAIVQGHGLTELAAVSLAAGCS